MSWALGGGDVWLLGGAYSGLTSELVHTGTGAGGGAGAGLRYSTRWACAIPDPDTDTLVITGAHTDTGHTVINRTLDLYLAVHRRRGDPAPGEPLQWRGLAGGPRPPRPGQGEPRLHQLQVRD